MMLKCLTLVINLNGLSFHSTFELTYDKYDICIELFPNRTISVLVDFRLSKLFDKSIRGTEFSVKCPELASYKPDY